MSRHLKRHQKTYALAARFTMLLGATLVNGAVDADDRAGKPPNLVIVITDDQGYGDLGVHGNRWIRTPNLDRFAEQSVELTNFHVSPVCSPTRASLMTGRYNYRTGVVDTFLGRSLMFADEVTLAEMLAEAGYASRKVDRLSAHIDLVPTLLEACCVAPPAEVRFDGRSLWPLLAGQSGEWPARTLFFQWHRGDRPVRLRACAVVTDRWKLIQPRGAGDQPPANVVCELYDLPSDPFEQRDVSAAHPEIVERLTDEYEVWFNEMRAERDFALPRIMIGSEHENPVVLTRQDWRGPSAGWKPGDVGHWDVEIARPGIYNITLHFAAGRTGTLHCKIAGHELMHAIDSRIAEHSFSAVELPAGHDRIEAWVAQGGQSSGVEWLNIDRAAP